MTSPATPEAHNEYPMLAHYLRPVRIKSTYMEAHLAVNAVVNASILTLAAGVKDMPRLLQHDWTEEGVNHTTFHMSLEEEEAKRLQRALQIGWLTALPSLLKIARAKDESQLQQRAGSLIVPLF